MAYIRKITIISSKSPKEHDLNKEIQWFSNSLGLFNERDKEKSCFRIFINLLKEHKPLSSDQIAEKSNLTRATVIHHISKLMDSGLVISKENRYCLRVNKLEKLTREIEHDILDTFKRIKKISKEIDKELRF